MNVRAKIKNAVARPVLMISKKFMVPSRKVMLWTTLSFLLVTTPRGTLIQTADKAFLLVFILVSDRISVSVYGIGRNRKYRYRSRNFFYRNRNFFFFFKKFQKISKNFMYFCFLGKYKFLKTWNWTQIFKSYLKILKIWQQIWFKGLFYDWKNTPYYW